MSNDLTWQCDSGNCEHETDTRHERGSGVFCDECAARKIKTSFDPDQERADQEAAKQTARETVSQDCD